MKGTRIPQERIDEFCRLADDHPAAGPRAKAIVELLAEVAVLEGLCHRADRMIRHPDHDTLTADMLAWMEDSRAFFGDENRATAQQAREEG